MFRKAAAALTVGAVVFTLAACSSSAPASTDAGSTGSGGTGEAGGLISIIVAEPSNIFWKVEGETAAAEAEALGYDSKVSAHGGDVKKESDLVDTAIANKSVAVILDPANSDGSIGAVQKLVDANIPVFLVDQEINQSGLAKSQLISNNAQGAATGAQEWVKTVGTSGEYVELLGDPAGTAAAARSGGYASVLSQYPDLKLVGQEVANWDQTQGFDKMQSLLQAHPNIIGVISGNDTMALGAAAAIEQAGKSGQIKVGGFDGSPDAAAAVKAGTLQYTVLQPMVEYTKAAVQQADSYIRTGSTGVDSEKQSFDCTLINKDNVGSYTSFALE